LNVASRRKVDGLSGGQLQHQFLDERGDVAVRADRADPLFRFKDLVRNGNLHVLPDRNLAGKPHPLAGCPAVDMVPFGRQDVAAPIQNLDLALRARSPSAASRRKEQSVVRQNAQQLVARRHDQFLLLIDQDSDLARRDQPGLGDQNHHDQRQHDRREH
jgi:hypothetical protein